MLEFSAKTKEWLLREARHHIEYFLDTKSMLVPDINKVPEDVLPELKLLSGLFVIITKKEKHTKEPSIRGMMGSIHAADEVWKLVGPFAVNAAFFDFRTPRLKPYELNEITITICFPEFFEDSYTGSNLTEVLDAEQPGLLAAYHNRESYLLPHAWHDILEAEQFIRILLLQLGIRPTLMWDEAIEYKPFKIVEVTE